MEEIIGTVPGKYRKKREKERLPLPLEISWNTKIEMHFLISASH